MPDAESETANPHVFVQVDEDDPFEMIQLLAVSEDGEEVPLGRLEAEPGRYELRRVNNADD